MCVCGVIFCINICSLVLSFELGGQFSQVGYVIGIYLFHFYINRKWMMSLSLVLRASVFIICFPFIKYKTSVEIE